MPNEAKVKVEIKKTKSVKTQKPKRTNITYTEKAYSNVLEIQKNFEANTGGSISHEKIINKVLEKTTSLK